MRILPKLALILALGSPVMAQWSVGARAFKFSAPAPPSPPAAFFAASSPFNTPLSSPTVDPNSAAMISNSFTGVHGGSSGTIPVAHFSNGWWGVTLVYVSSANPTIGVQCKSWDEGGGNTYTTGCKVSAGSIQFPIPASGVVMPTYSQSTDGNTAFIDTDTTGPYAGKELDCWRADKAGWTAGSPPTLVCGSAGYNQNLVTGYGNCTGQFGPVSGLCNMGYAAGINLTAIAVRPEEIQGGVIPHALGVALSTTGGGTYGGINIACPGTHTDRANAGPGMPEGAHFFLPASYNIAVQGAAWAPWQRMIFQALQTYGGYVIDVGGNFEVKGINDANTGTIKWASVGVPVDTGSLDVVGADGTSPWTHMQVVTMQNCNAG